jgi:hypothetical protein
VTLRVLLRPKVYDTPWDIAVDLDLDVEAEM